MPAHLDVRAPPGLADVGHETALADLVEPVLGPGARRVVPGVGRVHVRHLAEAELDEGVDERRLERLPAWALVALDVELALDAGEDRLDDVPAPAGRARPLPVGEVRRLPAHGDAAVDHRAAADQAPAVEPDPPAAGQRLTVVLPVVGGDRGADAREPAADHVAAGHEAGRHGLLVGEVLARPPGAARCATGPPPAGRRRAAGRARADDDDVGVLSHGMDRSAWWRAGARPARRPRAAAP